MQRWTYITVFASNSIVVSFNGKSVSTGETIFSFLDRMGQEGWEAINAWGVGNSTMQCILKRSI